MLDKQLISQEDEIDLGAIFKVIWRYRVIVLSATILFVLLCMIYLFFIAKPKYEISAVFQNGYYDGKISIRDIYSVVNELKVKWIENLKYTKDLDFKIESIKVIERENNGNFRVNLFALSNEIGIEKINEIFNDLQKKDKEILDDYINNIKEKLNLQQIQKLSLNTRKINLENDIKHLKDTASVLDGQIVSMRKKIQTNTDFSLQMQFLRNLDLKNSITKELDFLSKDLHDVLQDIYKIQNEEINLKSKLFTMNIQTTKLLSNIVVYDKPTKPNKALILTLSCFIGFFVSIFCVLVWDFIKKYKK